MHAYRSQVHLRESVLLWAWELNLSELAVVPLSLKLSLQCTGLEGLISVLFACLLFMCADVLPHLPPYILVHFIFAWNSRQEEVLGPLKLELWKVVSYHMGNGNQTQIL